MGTSLQFFYWSTGKEGKLWLQRPRLTETIHTGFGALHLMEEVVELR